MREPEATIGAIFGLLVALFIVTAVIFFAIMISAHLGIFGMEITYP